MARTNKKGQVVRVSNEVFEAMLRKKEGFRSWDALLRCAFGLRPKRGVFPKVLREGYVIPQTGRFFERAAEARGEAVKLAVRVGSDRVPSPVRMREIL